ncbi:MAG: hypothetical protein JNK48_08065 [Bryobacterales bacterium]|nr:hypothetical protein [Bryobacterales bacterium]
MMLMEWMKGLIAPEGASGGVARQAYVSGALLRTMLEGQFRDMRIELRHSPEHSSIGFPSAIGLPPLRFRASGGTAMLHSRQVFVSFCEPEAGIPNGAIEFEFWMAPDPGAAGAVATITVRLALSVRAGSVGVGSVAVRGHTGDDTLDKLIGTVVEAFYYWVYTREAVEGAIAAAARQSMGCQPAIVDARISQGRLALQIHGG